MWLAVVSDTPVSLVTDAPQYTLTITGRVCHYLLIHWYPWLPTTYWYTGILGYRLLTDTGVLGYWPLTDTGVLGYWLLTDTGILGYWILTVTGVLGYRLLTDTLVSLVTNYLLIHWYPWLPMPHSTPWQWLQYVTV